MVSAIVIAPHAALTISRSRDMACLFRFYSWTFVTTAYIHRFIYILIGQHISGMISSNIKIFDEVVGCSR